MKLICENKEYDVEEGIALKDALADVMPKDAIAARYNNEIASLNQPVNKNGTIERDELLEVLTLSLSENHGVNISQAQLSKIVNATYKKMDKNGDGRIDLAEFQLEAQINPSILTCVNVNLDVLLK